MPLSGMILNMKPNFMELWWHESNFPFLDCYGTRPKLKQGLNIPRGFFIHEITTRQSPREDTRFLIPKRNSSSVSRQFVDYYSTRPMKRQYLYFPRRNHHSRRQRLVDYYGTRLMINKFSKFLEETIHPRDNRQFDCYGTQGNNSRQPTTSFAKRQLADQSSVKKKVLYI